MDALECRGEQLEFQGLNGRRVAASFDGGEMTSDGGAMLLREAARQSRLLERFAACFSDARLAVRVEHSVCELVSQRVLAICCGYEDLNDHNTLRQDALFGLLVGKDGRAGAGQSTLNRLELSAEEVADDERYKKISCSFAAVEKLLVDVFVESFGKRRPRQVIIDLDATDFPLHGNQEGKFFHGYYNHYCYLPLYLLCGDHLLGAKLRESNIDGAAGAQEEVQRIVLEIRKHFPNLRIILRADSGFARDTLMTWCEENTVDYLFGLAKNERLNAEIAAEMALAEERFQLTAEPARVFKEFQYRTLDSWSRARRVIGKAEYLEKGANPRFVVTSLSRKASKAVRLYEKWYCQRGDMENRIKEQLSLFADRVSAKTMRANQLRMFFSSIAYLLMSDLRRRALKDTVLARAQFDTIRLRLLKIGARIRKSVRRFFISFSSGYPWQQVFRLAHSRLTQT
jgi:hypothetical protein